MLFSEELKNITKTQGEKYLNDQFNLNWDTIKHKLLYSAKHGKTSYTMFIDECVFDKICEKAKQEGLKIEIIDNNCLRFNWR